MKRVAIVGPGRVGGALALALPRAGYEVVGVAGRGAAALRTFAELAPRAVVGSPTEVARAAGLVVLSVPDDALAAVVREVARADGVAEGSRWVHVSGGHALDVLEPARLAGAQVAAIHPAQTFPDARRGADALPGTSWAVTARPPDLGWARVLVTDLRGSPVDVAAGSRTLYHAGLTVGSNASASVVTLARDLLLGAGVTDPAAFLGPLVTTSVAGAADRGAAALTGPVRRGDAGTVGAHLAELREVMPEAVDAYLALSRLALRHARRAGLDDEAADAVGAVLGAEPGEAGAAGAAGPGGGPAVEGR